MRLKEIKDESGFTLIEILVVILIIGILASIAIPIFFNQRKKSIEASVQSDLKNASIAMEAEMASNSQKYLSYLPNYNPQSSDVIIRLDATASSANQYCLTATSQTYPEIRYYYDSTRGGILKTGESCTPLGANGGSFNSVLATKKALIIAVWGDVSVPTTKNFLLAKGFSTVDYKDNPPVSEYAGYDLIVLMGANGTIRSGDSYAKMLDAYNKGYKILTDGNDSTKSSMPFIKDAIGMSSSTTSFNKTSATGISPSFPYTYTEPTFNVDSAWVCPTAMIPEMVVLATGPNPKGGLDCITASAMTTGQGRWLHLIQAPLNSQKGITSDAIDWLMM